MRQRVRHAFFSNERARTSRRHAGTGAARARAPGTASLSGRTVLRALVARLQLRVLAETRGPAESFQEKFTAFRGTRGERQRVFPSRARPETRRCERNDARGTSGLPGGGVLRPCRHDCALLEPVAAAHATGTPCRPGRSRGHADASCDIIRLSSFRNASRRVFVFFVFRLTLLSFLARRPTGESRELTRTYCETD